MEFIVRSDISGKTVLEILKKELRLSAKMITELKKRENGITVNGCHVTVRRILTAGDVLRLQDEDTAENKNLVKTETDLDIIYEDSEIIVVNKPPMMPTHPSHGHFDDTLANGVAFHMGDTPFVFRAVNRLDKNTSGTVLIAKNRVSASRLYASMQKGEIKKEYIAMLDGTLPKSTGIIDTHIRRKEASIITREICDSLPDSHRAITEYEAMAVNENISVALARPITGRTHQLRLHFSYLGAPIIGDDMYGNGNTSDIIQRQALHALRLTFPHPLSGEIMTFTAPLPEDMKTLLKKYNLRIEV